ncbi:phosphodiester glycosidase family protein [Hymenobacter glacieicola]|uniref:Lipoprotein signal peptide n=1 Tax=Hymenobacter glacieicola TaxID=1562124 RepID=A0ABQ1WZ93_9BACT|nr:phosphodiester glycosidase family protein [Hymenobacter glacieicola]GGG47558.1 lipoprotein signal peptide [Hymenobacter glacieicola]
MKVNRTCLLGWAALLGLGRCHPDAGSPAATPDLYLSYPVNPQRQQLRFYWQDDQGQPFRSILRLRSWLTQRQQQLIFATNGGMYKAGNIPLGLYVEQGVVRTPLDTSSGPGNFYLKPNGVFFLTAAGQAGIVPTAAFRQQRGIRYATQSGPLLVVGGQIHPAFSPRSANVNIRNGAGILPDGTVLFAMSKTKVTLHDFATYFRQQGCQNALYLDGFVSRTYLPEKQWEQTDGDFGVIIGVTAPAR